MVRTAALTLLLLGCSEAPPVDRSNEIAALKAENAGLEQRITELETAQATTDEWVGNIRKTANENLERQVEWSKKVDARLQRGGL